MARPSFLAALAIIVTLIALTACDTPDLRARPVDIVDTKVPVAVKREAPSELLDPIDVKLPVFTNPSNPRATSALTVDGEADLRILLYELVARVKAWEAFYNVE